MNNDFLPYARQSIDAEDIDAITKALRSSFITRGPLVEQFERAIADYCDAKFAVAFSSGSTALSACCQAAKTDQFDKVITTPNTFVSTIGGAIQQRATPIFVDIELDSGNLNLEQVAFTLEKSYTQGKPIIIPVHFSGLPVNMAKLDRLIKNPNTVVIEDACHALGSRYLNGQRVGCCAWSQMTVFSFHPAKTITTGEGGMVTTNDAELYHQLKLIRNNGIERDPAYFVGQPAPWHYEIGQLSNNYNFTEFQAALGLSQFKKLDAFIEKRRQLVATYRQRLSNHPSIRLFADTQDSHTCFHLFVVQIDFKACHITREKVMQALSHKQIGTQVHYIPVYRHPFFEERYGKISSFFPMTESYFAQALSLPLYYDLTIEQVHRVADELITVLQNGRA